MNKKNLYIPLIVILIALVIIFARNKPAAEVSREPNNQNTASDVRDLCYIWNSEGGDSISLLMYIKNGTEVSGSFNWLPYEKDKKTGPIEGTAGQVDPKAMARTADLVWTATQEGITHPEQLFVKFGEGNAAAGFGTMIEKNGMYIYSDPKQIKYEPNLQQTNCDDLAIK